MYLGIYLAIIIVVLSTPVVKGMLGELAVAIFLKFLNKEIYKVFHDLYIPKEDGTTTQIDHVITSPFGIFVVETKNYKGWIFGNEKSKDWTQVIYRTKNKFYNPIRQNKGHIKHLKLFLDYSKEDAFVSIISFSMRGTLKKINTDTKVLYSPALVHHIKKFKDITIEPEDLMRINKTLSELGRASFKTRRDHIRHIKSGSRKTTTVTTVKSSIKEKQSHAENVDHFNDNERQEKDNMEKICPRCGEKLVERKGKRGNFIGCSGYPKCRYTA